MALPSSAPEPALAGWSWGAANFNPRGEFKRTPVLARVPKTAQTLPLGQAQGPRAARSRGVGFAAGPATWARFRFSWLASGLRSSCWRLGNSDSGGPDLEVMKDARGLCCRAKAENGVPQAGVEKVQRPGSNQEANLA